MSINLDMFNHHPLADDVLAVTATRVRSLALTASIFVSLALSHLEHRREAVAFGSKVRSSDGESDALLYQGKLSILSTLRNQIRFQRDRSDRFEVTGFGHVARQLKPIKAGDHVDMR